MSIHPRRDTFKDPRLSAYESALQGISSETRKVEATQSSFHTSEDIVQSREVKPTSVSPTHETKKLVQSLASRMAAVSSKLEQTPGTKAVTGKSSDSNADTSTVMTTDLNRDGSLQNRSREEPVTPVDRKRINLAPVSRAIVSSPSHTKEQPQQKLVNRRALAKARSAQRWQLVKDNIPKLSHKNSPYLDQVQTVHSHGSIPTALMPSSESASHIEGTANSAERKFSDSPNLGSHEKVRRYRSRRASLSNVQSYDPAENNKTEGPISMLKSTSSFRRGTLFGTYTQEEAEALRRRNIDSTNSSNTMVESRPTLPYSIKRLNRTDKFPDAASSEANADEADRLLAGKPTLKQTKSWAVRGVIPASRRRASQASFAGTTPSSMRRLRSASFTKPAQREEQKRKESGWSRTDRRPDHNPTTKKKVSKPSTSQTSESLDRAAASRQAILEHISRVVSEGRTLYGKRVSHLDDLFDTIDKNNTGQIDVDELRQAFIRLDVMGRSGKGNIATRSNRGIEELLRSMDLDGSGTLGREEFFKSLTPYGLKRGTSMTKKKTKRRRSSLQLSSVKPFDDSGANILKPSSPRRSATQLSKTESLEMKLATQKMAFAKREQELLATIKQLKDSKMKSMDSTASKDKEIEKLRTELEKADVTARLRSQAREMEFKSAEHALEERVAELTRKVAEDKTAQEVLKTLITEAGRNLSKVEEEKHAATTRLNAELTVMQKECGEREEERRQWEIERADLELKLSEEKSKSLNLSQSLSSKQKELTDIMKKNQGDNADRLNELHALKEAMKRMEISAEESYSEKVRKVEAQFDAERASWRVKMDQMDKEYQYKLDRQKGSAEKLVKMEQKHLLAIEKLKSQHASAIAALQLVSHVYFLLYF